jgi:hypothetical protein
MARSWDYRSATTAPDGAFRLAGLPEGAVEVTASAVVAGRRAEAEGTFSAGKDGVVLALSFADEAGPGRIVVRVLDGEGKPVPAATVRFETERSSETVTASDGTAVLEPDAEGEGTVEVGEARASDGSLLPLGRARVEKVAPGAPVVVVRLPPERAIAGVVRDASGAGVPAAHVAASPASDPHLRADFDDAATTAVDGTFRVGQLGEGEHVVYVRPPPGFVRPEPVRASAGATGVEVVLRRGSAASVTVLDADGKPVRGAVVEARHPLVGGPGGGRLSHATTDGRGLARLDGLPADESLELRVHPPRDRSDVLELEVAPWAPRDETVRLGRAFRLRGRVVDSAGRPVAGARVFHVGEEFVSVYRTRDDGGFEARGLPWKETSFRVSVGAAESGVVGDGQEFRVAAGTSEAVFTVDPGLSLTVRVTGAESDVRVSLLLEKDGGREEVAAEDVGTGEPRVFRGLRPGAAYAVWAHAAAGGGHALRTGVRGGDDVRLALVPGRTIGVRLRGAFPPESLVEVRAEREGLSAAGVRVSPDTYEIRGVPEGTWVVQAHAFTGTSVWVGSAKAVPGKPVDVELTAARESDDE